MAATKKKAVAKRKTPARPRGRPTKFTVSVSARIVKAVALGLSYRDAATAGGVHEKTLEKWRKRGARELNSNSIYARFVGALRYVKLKAEGLWPTCLVGGVRSRSKERRGGRTVRPMPSAWRKGQDMTVPVRALSCSRRVFGRGLRAAAPRTGLVLASLAAMAPPRRPASVALPTVHRRRAVAP